MIQPNMHEILNDLKWQIEAGIDEVISDEPIIFSNEINSKENKKIKNVSSIRFVSKDKLPLVGRPLKCSWKKVWHPWSEQILEKSSARVPNI